MRLRPFATLSFGHSEKEAAGSRHGLRKALAWHYGFCRGQAQQVFAEMQRGIAPPPDIISITSLITACEKGLGFLQSSGWMLL